MDHDADPLEGLPEGTGWKLGLALEARKGRDRWRNVGEILADLRESRVPWKLIVSETGISRATGARMLAQHRARMGRATRMEA